MRIEEAKQILRKEYPGKSISVSLTTYSYDAPNNTTCKFCNTIYKVESDDVFDDGIDEKIEAIAVVHLNEVFVGLGPTFKAAIENLRTKVNPLIETPDIADDGNDPEHEEVTGAEITPAMRSEWSREAAAESLRGKP
jgi:hypothetical protein